jgi:flavin reductase (DIM6/NTAB) family NADH-FMN oxidoreductase RutF
LIIDATAPAFDWRAAYKLFLGFVNPRPIALVSTVSPGGVNNLAPFSFYNMVSANPPVLMFCPALSRTREPKHTYRNVQATGEFVVAVVHEAIAPQMVRAAADLPYEQSEFDFSGLTPAPARHVRAALVREAAVNIECRVRQIVPIGDGPGAGQVVFGDVLAAHVDDSILNAKGDAVDPHKLRTVGRLGEAWYCTVREPFELQIPAAPR